MKKYVFVFINITLASLLLIPLLIFNNWLFFNDNGTYLANIQYLINNNFNKLANPYLYQWTDNMYLYQIQSLRIGFQLFAASVAKLIPIKTIFEIYPIFAFIGEMFFLGSIVYFLKKALQASPRVITTTLLLIGLAVSLNYKIILLGFMPQLYGISLYILSLTQLIIIVRNKSKDKKVENYFFYFFIIPALMITYQEIFPFFLLTIALLLFYYLISKRNNLQQTFLKGLFLISPLIVFYPITLMTIRGLLNQFSAVVGWNEKVNLFDFITMVFGQDIYRVTASKWKLLLTLPGRVIAIIITILAISKLTKERNLGLLLIISFPFVLGLVYFGFFTINPFDQSIGNSWSIYKIIQWSYWLFCIALAIGIDKLKLNRLLTIVFVLALMPSYLLNLKNTFINWPRTINLENKTNNMIKDYKTISYDDFKYKPANLYSPNTHFMNPYCILIALNDKSRGVFLPLNNSQLFIREIQNVLPRKNHYHWIHYQTYSLTNKKPLYSILGYNIYSAITSLIYSKNPLLADIRHEQIIYTNIYSGNIYLSGNLKSQLQGKIRLTNLKTSKSTVYNLDRQKLLIKLKKGFNIILLQYYPDPNDNIKNPISIENLKLISI